MIELQKRDREIMKFVFSFRVASFAQIQKRFFTNVYRTVSARRIRQLASAGFLQIFIIGDSDLQYQFVRLTEKGWRVICELWPFEIDNPLFKSESPIHDIRAAELLFSFENLSTFKDLITENLFQSSAAISSDSRFESLARLHADGALILETQNKETYVYGVEFEISKKTPDRYREKLLNYYMASGIDGVLYISDSQITLDAIARIDGEIRSSRESILHLALERDVVSSSERISFRSLKGGQLELY